MNYPLSPAALAQHIAILGKTGSGKSVTAKGAIEDILRGDPGARVCILDPIKSDWWGMTSSADGKRPGLPFVILGGPHGHVPLHPSAGQAVGELVGRGDLPLSIVDMADFPMGGLQHFFTDFGAALMRSMRGVLHLVLEEAHEFAPKERSGASGENMAVYQAKKLATAGRSKGIRMVLVTQRTQSLHNALLGSCDTMVAHRLTAPADQTPVKEWLKAHFDKATLERVGGSLASLRTGTAWVCSGEDGAVQAEFPTLTTFDNSATPTSQDSQRHVTTAPVDRDRLAAIMGQAVEEAKANDPATLKARIKELEAKLTNGGRTVAGAEQLQAEYQRGRRDGAQAQHGPSYQAGWIGAKEAGLKALGAVPLGQAPQGGILLGEFGQSSAPEAPARHTFPDHIDRHGQGHWRGAPPSGPALSAPPPPRQPRSSQSNLKPALQRVVNAIGWWRQIGHNPIERDRACVVAGLSPKASTFSVYISELIKLGLVVGSPGKVALTPEGVALAVVPAGETREQIRDVSRGLLGQQERRVFDVVYAAYPKEIARVAIAEQLGLSPTASTLSVYISQVAAFGIIENGSRGHVRAAGWLFP